MRTFCFEKDDVIILYTDGVTEAESPDGQMYDVERICESALRRRNGNADEIKSGIIDDLMAFIAGQKIYDDISLLVMKHR